MNEPIDWSSLQHEQNEVQSYSPNWENYETRDGLAKLLADLFDGAFDWVNVVTRYTTIEEQRKAMLQADPSLGMQNRNDGFELEAERLVAIQQRNSRGFTIIDINPGLLTRLEYPLTLPFEFLFDGTNFMPDTNESLTTNFRTVNIPVQGNFVKVEYIWENNSISNQGSVNITRPYAARKYAQIAPDEQDLDSGKDVYSLDQFARNKVFLNFSSTTEKPIIVKRSGDSFNTWFNEVNVTLNMGAPKIRIIIGMNSEMHDGPSNDAINSRLSLAGGARLLADTDTVLSPFSICEQDNFVQSWNPIGVGFSANPNANVSVQLLENRSGVYTGNNTADALGYAVLWITRIYFNVMLNNTQENFLGTVRPIIQVVNQDGSEYKRVHQFVMQANTTFGIGSTARYGFGDYCFEPCEPIRVVIPSGCYLKMLIQGNAINTPGTYLNNFIYNFSIDGYSYGEILQYPVADIPGMRYLRTSKYVTDSTFLSDMNRVLPINRNS